MSLTRDEWSKMWESIKTIENIHKHITGRACKCNACISLRNEVQFIKDKIQQVVGQME